jgi:pimeloyl-ACP methyl ester carboxylesterase
VVLFLAQWLDRLAIRSAWSSVRHDLAGKPETVAEAAALLERPDLFGDAMGEKPDLTFNGDGKFRFKSPVATPWAENNVVRGKLYRAGRAWAERPSVILLHGWNGELGYHCQFPFLAWRLARARVNAAMIELPYHGQRKPRADGAVRNFISSDLARMLEATRQAVAETRALMSWLSGHTCGAVGLWGISMGAWLSGLIAAHEPLSGFAVLMSPVVRVDRAVGGLPFCEPIRRSLRGTNAGLDRLSLKSHRPRCGAANVLLIESRYDLFAPAETIEELWRAWEEPEIWRLPEGHISVLMSVPTMERTVRWVRRKALAPGPGPRSGLEFKL